MSHHPHLTTRRGFIGTLGFGGVALYGAWAGYGAAPVPFIRSGHGTAPDAHADAAQAHGAHGGGMTPQDFLQRHEEFMARYRQPDGSVAVGPELTDRSPGVATAGEHAMPATAHDAGHAMPDAHHGHATPPAPSQPRHDTAKAEPDPLDIYLHAFRFGFAPDDLRLRAGTRYRLRMMASDISHGASLQLGRGSRIIRLRTNIVAEQTIAFSRPGPVLVYCTVYCGPAHDAMQARILVA